MGTGGRYKKAASKWCSLAATGVLAAGLATVVHVGPASALTANPSNLVNPSNGDTDPQPVLINPTVYIDFWLPAGYHYDKVGSDAGDQAYMNTMVQFVKDLGDTPLFAIAAEYTGSADQPSPVNQLHFGGSMQDVTAFPSTELSDDDLHTAAARLQTHFGSPAGSDIYLVLTPRGANACLDESGGVQACTDDPSTPVGGWHDQIDPTQQDMSGIFAYVADKPSNERYPDTSAIDPHPSASETADAFESPVAHEIIEAVTDPFGHSWRAPDDVPNQDKEIGDVCHSSVPPSNPIDGATVYLHGHGYIVQNMWSNAAVHGDTIGGCAPTYCPADPGAICPTQLDFTVETTPAVINTGDTVVVHTRVENTDDASYARDVSATLHVPPSRTAAAHDVSHDFGAIAVREVATHVGGNFSFVADPPGAITGPQTTQQVCVDFAYTNSMGDAQPREQRCVDIVVHNDPPTLTVPGDSTVEYHHATSLAVSATDPNAGDHLSITASGLPHSLSLVDGGTGTATISGTANDPPGSYPVTISVDDGHNLPVSKTFSIVITPQATALTYVGDTRLANGEQFHPAALLRDDNGVPLIGEHVVFTVGAGQTCGGTTVGPTGVGSCTIVSAQPLVSDGRHVSITAMFAADGPYGGSTTTATARLVYLTARATAAIGTVLGKTLAFADTGAVTTPDASSSAKSVLSATVSPLTLMGLTSSAVTSLAPPQATAKSAASTVSIRSGLNLVTLSGLGIRASSSCAGGSSAVATVVTIKLNGLPVKVSVNPAPNTVLVVGLVRIVLNEQTSTTDAATGTTTITATAAHIMVAGVLDVRIAMVSTGVHNC